MLAEKNRTSYVWNDDLIIWLVLNFNANPCDRYALRLSWLTMTDSERFRETLAYSPMWNCFSSREDDTYFSVNLPGLNYSLARTRRKQYVACKRDYSLKEWANLRDILAESSDSVRKTDHLNLRDATTTGRCIVFSSLQACFLRWNRIQTYRSWRATWPLQSLICQSSSNYNTVQCLPVNLTLTDMLVIVGAALSNTFT